MRKYTTDITEILHWINNKDYGVCYFNDTKYLYGTELDQLVTFYTLCGEYSKWTGNHVKCDFSTI